MGKSAPMQQHVARRKLHLKGPARSVAPGDLLAHLTSMKAWNCAAQRVGIRWQVLGWGGQDRRVKEQNDVGPTI